ncbi:DUF7261 family protein [Halorubrum lacusprofundi]|jgi:hypothetical protein|uniref:Uncharacterized protein n=1 Tax=Halorubrum lacusprofundi (strain ATCC 49239 / DSM 5036 / JCM 8891 / ACAM 34) TaxID=416348 RepID=B9LMI4_HALLT|nr:hypothetical protein [Halorubrum lacusprofundi]ACM56572.1 hypothetical protein Hlac_0974 [Halorubrum lacusprofundi ATCC 49239]MCG1005161.1 hypothetical protein [Halorubrum lacusprofundi]
MADVSIGPPDGDRLFGGEDTSNADRAQLLLVAGLVMAVSLVTLVVLLNATIYSENVATRGIESADGEALEVRATAVDGTGELLDATNRAGPTDHADAAETVRNGVKDLDREASRSYAERGGVARIELLEIRNGSRITTDMAAVDPNASTLAADVDRTRGFVLDVDPGSLVETNASGAVDNAFHVELNDSTGGTHQVYVYNGTDGNVTVAVGDNSGEPTVWCETPPDGRDRVAVDLTGERLGGRSCPGIWPTALVAPDDAYDITLMSANAAAGEAAATVRAVSGDTVTTNLTGGRQPAVYEATIGLRYRTAELRFETDVRVVPGEPNA